MRLQAEEHPSLPEEAAAFELGADLEDLERYDPIVLVVEGAGDLALPAVTENRKDLVALAYELRSQSPRLVRRTTRGEYEPALPVRDPPEVVMFLVGRSHVPTLSVRFAPWAGQRSTNRRSRSGREDGRGSSRWIAIASPSGTRPRTTSP
jgi:hypothetical protein